MQRRDMLREMASRTMRDDVGSYDLAIELAHCHVNKALDRADNDDWVECLDQLYRASHLGGRPYRRLYSWLASMLQARPRRVQYSWLAPRDSYYRGEHCQR